MKNVSELKLNKIKWRAMHGALVVICATTSWAGHAAWDPMVYRLGPEGDIWGGRKLSLVAKSFLTEDEITQMRQREEQIQDEGILVWRTGPNGERLPTQSNGLCETERALWQWLATEDKRIEEYALHMRAQATQASATRPNAYTELTDLACRLADELGKARAEVASNGLRINPVVIDDAQWMIVRASAVAYLQGLKLDDVVVRRLNCSGYGEVILGWIQDAYGGMSSMESDPMSKLAMCLNVKHWKSGELKVLIPSGALAAISRSEQIAEKLSIERRTEKTVERHRLAIGRLNRQDKAVLYSNHMVAHKIIQKLKRVCQTQARYSDGVLRQSAEGVERREAMVTAMVPLVSRHSLIRELCNIQMTPGQFSRELARLSAHSILTGPKLSIRDHCNRASRKLLENMPNSTREVVQNEPLMKKIMEQTNQLLQTISEAGAIRPDERADMWKDAAPVVEIIRVRVPEQLQAPTQSGSTDMKTIRLQRVGMRSVINMNHRVVEICDYTIGMIKNMAYKEKELETAWHTRVGIDERFAVEIGYDVAEGGRFPASMRTTRTSNRLSYRVVDEMRRQLEGMGADELVEALKRSCIGVDVTDPHAAVSLYLQGGMLDSAAIREIIDLADGAGSRKYGRKGRTIWLLGVVQKTVAEAEEVVRRGDRQAIAMEAGAMAQSLKRWIVAWMEAHPAKGQETEQDLQLILQLEKIVEPLARIQVDKSKLIEYAREIVSSIKEHNECDGLIQAYERELAGRSDTARRLFERLEARKRAAMAEAERARVERS